MKQIAPDYLPEFACIAGACRHTCCAGWEIDVDPGTLARWDALPEPFGSRVRAAVDRTGETPALRLDERERCVLLRPDGLCNLICQAGPESLCAICADHPRFRSFFADRTETGLGLCCEAAAGLILTRETPMRLVLTGDDGADDPADPEEEELRAYRGRLIAALQDRTKPFAARIHAARMPRFPEGKAALALFRQAGLEFMTDELPAMLSRAAAKDVGADAVPELFREQLGVYLLFRHVPDALVCGADASACAAAALAAGEAVALLCAAEPDRDPCDIARLFSAEIEYSDVNTALLCRSLSENP